MKTGPNLRFATERGPSVLPECFADPTPCIIFWHESLTICTSVIFIWLCSELPFSCEHRTIAELQRPSGGLFPGRLGIELYGERRPRQSPLKWVGNPHSSWVNAFKRNIRPAEC